MSRPFKAMGGARHALRPAYLALLCLILLIGESTISAAGAGNTGSWAVDRPPSARASGMGGAFVGLADDGFAGWWNPAGLVHLRQTELCSMYEMMTLDRKSSFISGAYPFLDGVSSLGFSWYRQGVESIPVTELDPSSVISVDAIGNPVYGIRNLGYIEDISNLFTLSVARSLNDYLSAGMNFKYLGQRIGETRGYALGMDFSFLMRGPEGISLGGAVRNIAQTMHWNSDTQRDDNMPLSLVMGVDVNFKDAMHLLFDIEKTENCDLEYHIGAEATIMEVFSLRLGMNDGRVTGGTSVRFNSWRFDYSYIDDVLGINHRLSSSFRFNAAGN
ncbi:MAG: hypothetical protein CVV64_01410 [Candidatus Wallbacteria bacterium HGW-Wallbacteria-1]|jgi:hypothetical protein|uniref:PorV/PorQ family protein n=1 Tax=Candidatus Wallbacteria bacterium HGW-Wallbacteria-1 TaxID=2013854 RepID=A0A2N1PUU2_9BACT|nr:MAG: hypothetical protein CVV64_01410 [Candidatus Wallbacteria bacterium HGW-Wallbacteria-1]